MNKIIFPDDFTWGAATASYQIEGAYNEDGKGKSIWDRFTHERGNIKNNDTGDIACNHYHEYKKDIELMKKLGLDSYRFSISWPRILPKGKGKINQQGLDFYRRLIDELLQAEISPAVTLYHWDLPQVLQDNDGWVNRDTVKYYNEYAHIMFKKLGDVVPLWITHNEPFVASFVGNLFGEHAPGYTNFQLALQVAHNLLVSHGLAVKTFRESGCKGEIGITLNLTPTHPNSESKKDKQAVKFCNGFINDWFLQPLFKGQYPAQLHQFYKNNFGNFNIKTGDMEKINQEIDFLGINYYTRAVVKYNSKEQLNYREVKPEGRQYTDMDWEIYPEGLYEILKYVNQNYTDIPLYITENGAAFADQISKDGKPHDQNRINYLKEHFKSAYRALTDGIPLKGYFVWSLMDNFEWAFGYSKRFGLIYIDYANNQKRILKDSARWYKEVIKKNGIEI